MSAEAADQEAPPVKDITGAVATLQNELATAYEEFHMKVKDEEQNHIQKIEAIIKVITSTRQFHAAINTNTHHAALFQVIYAELEDIRQSAPSKLFQVERERKRPPVNRALYQPLVMASAAVTILMETEMNLDDACKHVIKRLREKIGLKFPTSNTREPIEDWQRLKSWRNNFVNGGRDVSDNLNDGFFHSYKDMLEYNATTDNPVTPEQAAEIIIGMIPSLLL